MYFYVLFQYMGEFMVAFISFVFLFYLKSVSGDDFIKIKKLRTF